MTALLFLVVFVLAIDQFSMTRILHRPLVACTLIGLVLGDMTKGIMVGGALELTACVYKTSTDTVTMRNTGFLLISVVATVLSVTSGLSASEALGAAFGVLALGLCVDYLLVTVNTLFLPFARKAAENRDEKKLALANFLPMILEGTVFGILAVFAYQAGGAAADQMNTINQNFGWVLSGLSIAGMMMPCVGFAVLLRNIGVKDVPGALFGGIAAGALIILTSASYTGLLLAVFMAFAVGTLDYHMHVSDGDQKTSAVFKADVKTEEKKEVAEKWW